MFQPLRFTNHVIVNEHENVALSSLGSLISKRRKLAFFCDFDDLEVLVRLLVERFEAVIQRVAASYCGDNDADFWNKAPCLIRLRMARMV